MHISWRFKAGICFSFCIGICILLFQLSQGRGIFFALGASENHEAQKFCQNFAGFINDDIYVTGRQSRTYLVDAFVLYNELDVLLIRLHELWNVVDKFIVVEASETFTGRPRRFLIDSNRNNPSLKPFLSKIDVVKCEFPSNLAVSAKSAKSVFWAREYFSRNCAHAALVKLKQDASVVIIGDVDEIPSVRQLHVLKSCESLVRSPNNYFKKFGDPDVSIKFTQDRLHFNFHCRSKSMGSWPGSQVWSVKDVLKRGVQTCKDSRGTHTSTLTGGWHFSNFPFGNPQHMVEKFSAFSHQEETSKISNTESFWSKNLAQGGSSKVNTQCEDVSTLQLPVFVIQNSHLNFSRFLNDHQRHIFNQLNN